VVSGISITNASISNAYIAGGIITNAWITNSIVSGNGSGLNNLNGSSISSGTVAIANLPVATSSTPGIVQPDNATITINGSGVLSAVSSQNTNIVALSYDSTGTNVLLNGAGYAQVFHLLITTNTYFVAPTNFQEGQSFVINLYENSTGGYSVDWDTNYWIPNGGQYYTALTNAGSWTRIIGSAGQGGTNLAFGQFFTQ
jgi:hypothetical protein